MNITNTNQIPHPLLKMVYNTRKEYIYEPLTTPGTIRLLQLQRLTGLVVENQSPIVGTIHVVALSDYKQLQY